MSERAARLTPALAGIATLVMTYLLGAAALGRRAAWIATVALATSPLFFALSQVLIIDMLLTACMTAATAAVYAAHRAVDKRGFAVCGAVASALAVLAKGPVGLLLPGAIGLAFLLWRRDLATVRALAGPLPLLCFVAIATPWFVVVSLRNPEFPHYFFVREHLQRFATDQVGHPEGALFYAPVLLGGLFPWTLLAVLLALTKPGRRALRRLPREQCVFFLAWAAIIVVFFTIARSKLPSYILPAFPPLALLCGAWLDQLLDDVGVMRTPVRGFATSIAAVAVLILIGALVSLGFRQPIAAWLDHDATDVLAIGVALCKLGGALLLAALVARNLRVIARVGPAGSLAIVSLGLACGMFAALSARTVTKTSRVLASAVMAERAPGDLLVAYRKFMQGLSFYTRGRVVQVMAYNELDVLAMQSPDRAEFFWDDTSRLAREWSSGRRVFIATNRELEPALSELLEPEPRVLVRDDRRVVLVNFPEAGARSAPNQPTRLAEPGSPARSCAGCGGG
jgi:4-amino-4-deoxy-L-arabinose transferase-like glycosyltransferase